MTELTRRVVAGYLGDLGGVWLAEDVTFLGPEAGSPPAEPSSGGRWQAAAWLARGSLSGVDRPQVQLTRLLAESEHAAAEWMVTGRDRGSGRRIAVPMAGVFHVADGEITQLHLYGNAVAVRPERTDLPSLRY